MFATIQSADDNENSVHSLTFCEGMARFACVSLVALSLAACGSFGGGEDDAEGEDTDPAVEAALEDPLLVDPDLTQQSNENAVLDPQGPPTGAIPGGSDDAEGGKAAADVEVASSGEAIISAPEPKRVSAEDCATCKEGRTGVTLAAKAEIDAGKRGKGTCDAQLNYSLKWAQRMPTEFKVYPRANVKEAAGVDGGVCDIRVVSFTTPVAMKDVVDYYYTRARRTGYSAEYVIRDGEHTLGGTRDVDEGAYVAFFRRTAGRTQVDIVANNGR